MQSIDDNVKSKDVVLKQQNYRNGAVDLLRCFGIVLMIMGHVGFGSLFDKYVHAFHMPLWFFITGMFCRTNVGFVEYAKKKAFKLLIPYLSFGLIYELINAVRGGYQWNGLLLPNSVQVPIAGALWFLPALFFVSIIGFVVLKYVPKIPALCLLGVIALFGSLHLIELPLAIDSAMIGAGFFLCGYLVWNYAKRLLNLKWYIVAVSLIVNALLIFMNGDVNLRTCTCSNIALFWINGIVATVVFYNVCRMIDSKFDLPLLKKIGSDSIIYICTNQIILVVLNKLRIILFPMSEGLFFELGYKVFEVGLIIIIGSVSNYLLCKTPLSALLGKHITQKSF